MRDIIEVTAIQTRATPGIGVEEALRSALRLAADEWRPVEVEHNSRVYRFDPQAMVNNATPIEVKRA